MSRGANPDFETKYGMTPLIEAAKAGHGKVMERLMFDPTKKGEVRCDVNQRNMYGKNARDYAIEAGFGKRICPILDSGGAKAARLLIDSGAVAEDEFLEEGIAIAEKKPLWRQLKESRAAAFKKFKEERRRKRDAEKIAAERERAARVLQKVCKMRLVTAGTYCSFPCCCCCCIARGKSCCASKSFSW